MNVGVEAEYDVSEEQFHSEVMLTAMLAGTPWSADLKKVRVGESSIKDIEIKFYTECELHGSSHTLRVIPHTHKTASDICSSPVSYAIQHDSPDRNMPPDRLQDQDTIYDAIEFIYELMDDIEEHGTPHSEIIA